MRISKKKCGKSCILNIETKADLHNVFRYIKELLLQHHNFEMYTDHTKFRNVGIQIFTVKSDAFTIRNSDAEYAKDILQFSNDIGGLRIS